MRAACAGQIDYSTRCCSWWGGSSYALGQSILAIVKLGVAEAGGQSVWSFDGVEGVYAGQMMFA